MTDERIKTLAKNLVNYSCSVRKGERVLIEVSGVDAALVCALTEEVYAAGGKPFISISDNKVQRVLLQNMSEEHAKDLARYASARMSEMHAYIGVRGGNNSYELSDVPAENRKISAAYSSQPEHPDLRVGKTKWVVLRYPTEGMSAQCKMSTQAFEDFYFKVCNLDYAKMDKAMDPLYELMLKTDKVHIKGKGTDLRFSIKGIGAEKCSGLRNIPDGEVYSAPVRDSVEGVVTFNTPSIFHGREFKDVCLTFSKGKIVKATANDTEAVNKIFDIDEGARYVGEFALGLNPFIEQPMGDILFDEKIDGSFHFTPGSCYKEADNGNQSAIHWDLVCIQTPGYGGGEIYFDGELIRKDGRFVLKELQGLNKENLI